MLLQTTSNAGDFNSVISKYLLFIMVITMHMFQVVILVRIALKKLRSIETVAKSQRKRVISLKTFFDVMNLK